jgi:hypothetical protein
LTWRRSSNPRSIYASKLSAGAGEGIPTPVAMTSPIFATAGGVAYNFQFQITGALLCGVGLGEFLIPRAMAQTNFLPRLLASKDHLSALLSLPDLFALRSDFWGGGVGRVQSEG